MRWIRNSPVLCEVCGNARLNGFCCGSHHPRAAANPQMRRPTTQNTARRVGKSDGAKRTVPKSDMDRPALSPRCTFEEMCVLIALHVFFYWRVHKGRVRSVVSRCATGAPSDSDPSPFACPSRHVYTRSLCSRWRNTWALLYPGWLPSLLCDNTHTHAGTWPVPVTG